MFRMLIPYLNCARDDAFLFYIGDWDLAKKSAGRLHLQQGRVDIFATSFCVVWDARRVDSRQRWAWHSEWARYAPKPTNENTKTYITRCLRKVKVDRTLAVVYRKRSSKKICESNRLRYYFYRRHL